MNARKTVVFLPRSLIIRVLVAQLLPIKVNLNLICLGIYNFAEVGNKSNTNKEIGLDTSPSLDLSALIVKEDGRNVNAMHIDTYVIR